MGSEIKLFKTTSGGKLSSADIENNFDDLHPLLSKGRAVVEAARCLYCYDAPCQNACPTKINIPKFIKQIHSGDADSAATTILADNILGGTCARACPTEELCEEVCVVNETEGAPIKIGELQRYAVEGLFAAQPPHPFKRAEKTGVTFAVIGAGPAGLAFAHRFAMLGNDVVLFEKREAPGGLNEYGLAEYKMAGDFAQKEIRFLLEVGGIEIRYGQALGETVYLDQLREEFNGVFIGVGLATPRALSLPGSELAGVENAIDFIDRLRQAPVKAEVGIGASVVVVGGGNTAIDAAVQARCLGADTVTLAYRRGTEEMSATDWEQQLASANGVNVINWVTPRAIMGGDAVEGVVFDKVTSVSGVLKPTGEQHMVAADTVLLAIGQSMSDDGLNDLKIEHGKIKVDERYQTSIPGVFAGGDCTATGSDLTVQAVEDGKQAAITAHALAQSAVRSAAE